MKARWIACAAAGMLACAWSPVPAHALGVEIWTDRGSDAVYEPGDALGVQARVSDDGFLMVYEIDAEGRVNLLFPYHGSDGYVEGRATYDIPPDRANMELVVNDPTGQAYLVAITSRRPFRDLPWYLKPYDAAATEVGYAGEPDDEEGITAEGRIVGDPFVAMERIRRRVIEDSENVDGFATAYTAYYVGHEVRYPRYLCYDCHRPNHWAWWSDFDPYYATCSVFDFRVNRRWYWGPGYWLGSVPYYYYVYRDDCAPRFRRYSTSIWYSSWDGWRRWCGTWGGPLTRHRSPPPPGYRPPGRHDDGQTRPPGYLAGGPIKSRGSMRPVNPSLPIGSPRREDDPTTTRPGGRGTWRAGDAPGSREPGVVREPGSRSPGGRDVNTRPTDRPADRRINERPRPEPVHAPYGTVQPRPSTRNEPATPAPRRTEERRRLEPAPPPRPVTDAPRQSPPPRQEPSRYTPRSDPPRQSPPHREEPSRYTRRQEPPREAPVQERPREREREKPAEERRGDRGEVKRDAPPPRERDSAPRPEPRQERGVRNGGERGRR